MKIVISLIFCMSAILLIGAINNFLRWKRPGVYPPKQVLKKRISSLAGGGLICLFVAAILLYFF